MLAAVILGRILKDVPSFLDNVDLIAGTSTGGLMALMLAAGYAPEECENIYKYACPLIFSKDPWRVYNPLKACSLLALLGFTSTKITNTDAKITNTDAPPLVARQCTARSRHAVY